MVFESGSPLLAFLQHYDPSGNTGQASSNISLDVCNCGEHYQFLASVSYSMVQWESTGSYLGIARPELKRLEKDNNSTSEQAFRMLHRWVTKGEPALVTKLMSALEHCSLRVHISNNEDAELCSLLAEIGHLRVTEQFLRKVAQKILSVWRFVGRFLGLSHSQLEAVWYSRGEELSSYQMLKEWMEKSDQATVNYKSLTRALFLMHHLDSSSVCDAWSYTRRHLTNLFANGVQTK